MDELFVCLVGGKLESTERRTSQKLPFGGLAPDCPSKLSQVTNGMHDEASDQAPVATSTCILISQASNRLRQSAIEVVIRSRSSIPKLPRLALLLQAQWACIDRLHTWAILADVNGRELQLRRAPIVRVLGAPWWILDCWQLRVVV